MIPSLVILALYISLSMREVSEENSLQNYRSAILIPIPSKKMIFLTLNATNKELKNCRMEKKPQTLKDLGEATEHETPAR